MTTKTTTVTKVTLKQVRTRVDGPIETEEYFYEFDGPMESIPEDESIKALFTKRSDAWYNYSNGNHSYPRINIGRPQIRIEHYQSGNARVVGTQLLGPRDYDYMPTGDATVITGTYTHGLRGESRGAGEALSRVYYD